MDLMNCVMVAAPKECPSQLTWPGVKSIEDLKGGVVELLEA